MTGSAGITERLAEYVAGAQFSAIRADVVDYTKRVVLDTLGCMVLGSTMPPGGLIRQYVDSVNGMSRATVIGGPSRASAPLAALANGTAGHADELDAVHLTHGHHPVVAVAAALAATEEADGSGADLVTAVNLSFDVGCRMLMAVGGREALQRAHHTHTSAPYVVGAAAAAGSALGLDAGQLRYAFALASYNVFSPMAFMDERHHMTKAMTHGQSAFAGVTGAMLAAVGFESNERILEAKDGLFEAWETPASARERLLDGLGERYLVLDTAFKPYSAGYPIQAPLAGALGLVRDYGIDLAAITRIRVGMSPQNAVVVDEREMPSICLQDMLSVGLACGRLGYDEAHDEANLARADVRRLRSTIEIVRDEALGQDPARRDLAWVEIQAAGATVSAPAAFAPGHWEDGGLDWAGVEDKFTTLVAPRLGAGVAAELIALVRDLERLPDLHGLGALLRRE